MTLSSPIKQFLIRPVHLFVSQKSLNDKNEEVTASPCLSVAYGPGSKAAPNFLTARNPTLLLLVVVQTRFSLSDSRADCRQLRRSCFRSYLLYCSLRAVDKL